MPQDTKAEGRMRSHPSKKVGESSLAATRGLASRNSLVEDYIDFAEVVVLRLIRSMHLPLACKDEFLSAAFLGLIEAASRYDPKRCPEFKAFAHIRIRGAIIDYIRSSLSLTGYAYQKFRALETAQDLREMDLETRISSGKRQQADRASPTAHLEKLAIAFKLHSEACQGQESGEECEAQDPESTLERKQRAAKIRSIVATLPEKERTIIEQYYFHDRKFVDVAREFSGLSKSWVSRLHDRALEILREKMAESVSEMAA